MTKPFLESYSGQTIQELIAMKESHRIDSLVLAIEQAVDRKPRTEISDTERVVLAVEALEREVNRRELREASQHVEAEASGRIRRIHFRNGSGSDRINWNRNKDK